MNFYLTLKIVLKRCESAQSPWLQGSVELIRSTQMVQLHKSTEPFTQGAYNTSSTF